MNLKIIVVGDYKSGKSSFIRRYIKGDFQEETTSTVGFNVLKKILKKDGIDDINLAIWDTGGLKSQIPPLKDKIFDQVDGAMVIIDVTNPNSSKSIKKWYFEIKDSISYDIPIYVIVSKKDLISNRNLFNEEEIKKTI
ncbi:MAG: GTP-binding protein, partial [Candidatus Heimdallarchaeota archaeon]